MHRTLSIARIRSVLDNDRGLTADEARTRLAQYGHNEILEVPTMDWAVLLRDTAQDPMLWFLFVTAAIFVYLGDYTEAATLFGAMIPLIGMDLYLHRRTRASTAALSSSLAHTARVQRAGETLEIPATDIVPGDLVTLSTGQFVPADGVIVDGQSLQMDESTLTGEAFPVRKQAVAAIAPTGPDIAVDSLHWTFAGTRVLTGSAAVRVVYTGAETLYGDIVRSAVHGRRELTPLQAAIARLVGVLIVAATILCVVLAWIRWQQGFGVVDALLSAITLAVAALPEEFPVVFTFFLGIGVFRLAQRQALVRRAVTVENIGRISCICTDKTGTITRGQLHIAHEFPDPVVGREQLLSIAALASRAETGDPLDRAVLDVAPAREQSLALVATFPFTEDRKRETAIWRERDGNLLAATKGAAEVVLSMCRLDDEKRAMLDSKIETLAGTGHKVIACASRVVAESAWSGGEPDRGLDFAGLLALEDPVREGVAEAIRSCQDACIHVLMVTGDHPATAMAIAQEIGLGGAHPKMITGDELETLIGKDGTELKTVDIIARAVPAHKLGVVRALQSVGEIVAVTGDGVNDVPALQAADIGIAMGGRGTRSAREVAAIVLLDDNFRSIVRAIAEGRQLFRNLKLSFAYLMMIHIPLVTTAAIIPLAGFPLLYLPLHIVWLELIIHPTALLVFHELPASEKLSAASTTQRPRFFSRRQWLTIAAVGVLVTILIVAGYERSLGAGRDVEHARAMTMLMLSLASAVIMVVLSGLQTRMSWIIAVATGAFAFVLVQVPGLSSLLHLRPLHADDVMVAVGTAAGIALLAAVGRFGREQ